MVLQIRRGVLKFKFCSEDVLRAFVIAQGLQLEVRGEWSPKMMKMKLCDACEKWFPDFA